MIRTSCKKTKAAVAALLALVLLLGSSFGAFAIGSYGDENYALIDEANIFTDEQMTSLCDKLSAAGSKTDWQLAVVTTNDNVSSSRMDSYYNNYYDNNRNVFEADCVMFVIDNASSNRIILTHGTAESYFTDERLTEMKSALKPSLASGDMVSAVQIFADTSVSFYEQGIPSDGHHSNHVEGKSEEQLASEREKKSNKFLWTLTHWGWLFGLIALAGGGIFAGVNVGRYKYNGKSGTYNLKENSSMNLLDKQDEFLGSHTSYTVISSSSSGSGGSSSGGGSSHGSSGSF